MQLNRTERDSLVEKYLPVADRLALSRCSRKPVNVTYEELQSAAYMGLLRAAEVHDPSKYPEFRPHRSIINGMMDYLREVAWGPRGSWWRVRSFDIETDDVPSDFEFLDFEVKPLLDRLGEIERKVLRLYYFKHMTVTEIGEQLGLSVGHVSRIKTKALHTLRSVLLAGRNSDVVRRTVARN